MPADSRHTRAWGAVRTAWGVMAVRVGLLGTALITIGSLTPAYLPQASPLWPILRSVGLAGEGGRVLGTVLTVCGVFLLVDAWFRLRHGRYAHLQPLAVVGLWCLPFLIAPPIFSHDMYSYAAQGWMVHLGQNPYDGGPGLVPGAFADYAPWAWRYTPAPYGPLAIQIARVLTELSGGVPWVAALLMRLPAIAAVAGVVWLLPRLGRAIGADVRQITWFACLNPLLVIDYVGGGHNDAWMMGLVVVGLWLATRPRWWPLAAVVIGLAASIKQPAILGALFLPLLTVPLASWREPRRAVAAVGRSLLALAIAVGTFLAVSWAAGLGFGWIRALGVPGTSPSISPAYLLGTALQWLVDPGGTGWFTWTGRVFLAAGAVFVAYCTVRYGPRRPLKALSWSWLGTALAVSALHSWYLLWGGLLLPLAGGRRRVPWAAILVVILMLCYAALSVGGRNGAWAVVAAVVALLAWLAHLVIYHRFWARRHRFGASSSLDPAPSAAPQRDDGDLRVGADADGRSPGTNPA